MNISVGFLFSSDILYDPPYGLLYFHLTPRFNGPGPLWIGPRGSQELRIGW